MNKSELLKVKGEKIVTSRQVTRSPVRIQTKLFSFFLSFLLFFLLSAIRYPLNATADSITIRTIVTPIGSQSEKWGAAGLMVCVGGRAISAGGCGQTDYMGVSAIPTSTGGTIDIEQSACPGDADCGKVFLFIDNGDHQFTNDMVGGKYDVVYEVRSSGTGDYVPGGHYGACVGADYTSGAGVHTQHCDIATGGSFDPISPATCNAAVNCECPSGFTLFKVYHDPGWWGWWPRYTCIKD